MPNGARAAVIACVMSLSTIAACSSGGPEVGDPARAGHTPAVSTGQSGPAIPQPPPPATAPGHVVVVVMENHSYADVIGAQQAPYINSLARSGVNLTHMQAITHPSQPNYVALFSGATHGVVDDRCPVQIPGRNLGTQLLQAHLSFAGYSEGLPGTGSAVCTAGSYARKHVPWADSPALPRSTNRPLAAFPDHFFASLPTVSFVIPDLLHDMHDGTIAQADTWLRSHLSRYASWARTHDSLLVLTWDEDDRSASNQIPTIVVGSGVRARSVARPVTLYSLLRLVEERYRLPHLGAAAGAPNIPLN